MTPLREEESSLVPRTLTSAGCAVWLALSGCGGAGSPGEGRAPDSTMRLAVRAASDTGRSATLAVAPPVPAVWVARVSPSPPGDLASLRPPDPEPPPHEADAPEPPRLVVDPGLKPPILRGAAVLAVPPAPGRKTAGRSRSVELDVRVDEDGTVSDARWAGGSRDTLLVGAAVESALGMRFYPALRAGRPVAVWCRQRFDFGR